jgi:hypothetical protein
MDLLGLAVLLNDLSQVNFAQVSPVEVFSKHRRNEQLELQATQRDDELRTYYIHA